MKPITNNIHTDNILFTIWTYKKGIGGHYYSLGAAVDSFAENGQDVRVINFGKFMAPSLLNIKDKVCFFKINKFNLLYIIYIFARYCITNKINIIHCFDFYSYYVSLLIGYILNISIVVTYPGGPNRTGNSSYLPSISNLICFSNENYDFFAANAGRLNIKNISLIKNRVKPPVIDHDKINELKALVDYDLYDFVFLKIARIGQYYKDSIIEAINLAKVLEEYQSKRVLLIIIGVIEDAAIYSELEVLAKRHTNIKFITSNKYIYNASAVLDICDAFIGTGRGVLEAISLGKYALTSAIESSIPVLITPDNIDTFAYYNFSTRSQADTTNNIQKIVDMISDTTYVDYSCSTKEYCKINYSYSEIYPKYLEFYSNIYQDSPTMNFKLLINLIILFKNVLLNKI